MKQITANIHVEDQFSVLPAERGCIYYYLRRSSNGGYSDDAYRCYKVAKRDGYKEERCAISLIPTTILTTSRATTFSLEQ
jgi:hypothetical protein